MATAIETDFDVEEFALRVAGLALEHQQRSEDDGIRRSLDAIRRWGERVPETLMKPAVDIVSDRYRERWLRDAEALIRVLDWTAFTNGRSIRVFDVGELGFLYDASEKQVWAFAAGCQLHELAGHLIEPSPTRTVVAAVAVHVRDLAKVWVTAPADVIGAAISAISLHEYAHHLDAQAAGRRIRRGTTLDAIAQSVSDGSAIERSHVQKYHGLGWARAYAHLLTRAALYRDHDVRVRFFENDIQEAIGIRAVDVLEATNAELVSRTADDALVDILRTPPPVALVELFDTTAAAIAAEEK